MDEWSGRKWEPVTEARLLRAIDVLVDLAKEHGSNFDPVLESVRQELHAFRRRKKRPADQAPQTAAPLRKAG